MTQVSNSSQGPVAEVIPLEVSLGIDVAIILIFSIFLISFMKNREKNYGLIMILILTLSDLGYPLMHILTIVWVKFGFNINVIGPIALTVNCFNLYWTAALALYTHLLFKSIMKYKIFHYKRFICFALLICLTLGLAFPLSIALGVWDEKINIVVKPGYLIGYKVLSDDMRYIYFFARNFMGKIVPLAATPFYYWQVHKALQNSSDFLSFTKNSTTRLFWLSFIPIACSLPAVLGDTFEVLKNHMNSKIVVLFVALLRYVWEFLNLWVYWRLQKGDERGSILIETPLLDIESTVDEEGSSKRSSLLKSSGFKQSRSQIR